MGVWSTKPWGNDEAADWFHDFWNCNDFELVMSEIENFNPSNENYDSVRAACYVVACFGSAYSWPIKYLDRRKDIMNKSIDILSKMINPPNDNWTFLDMWDNNKDAIASVENQIENIKLMLNE